MPTYEYKCDECNHRFSLVKSVKDRDTGECYNCKKQARRVLSFDGSVWAPTAGGYR